jgi:hypothetical protein
MKHKPLTTYTITVKTLCGKETTQTLEAVTPKEALTRILKSQNSTQNAKITKKSI